MTNGMLLQKYSTINNYYFMITNLNVLFVPYLFLTDFKEVNISLFLLSGKLNNLAL